MKNDRTQIKSFGQQYSDRPDCKMDKAIDKKTLPVQS